MFPPSRRHFFVPLFICAVGGEERGGRPTKTPTWKFLSRAFPNNAIRRKSYVTVATEGLIIISSKHNSSSGANWDVTPGVFPHKHAHSPPSKTCLFSCLDCREFLGQNKVSMLNHTTSLQKYCRNLVSMEIPSHFNHATVASLLNLDIFFLHRLVVILHIGLSICFPSLRENQPLMYPPHQIL